MRTMTRRATRDQLTKRNNDPLTDGSGGTITGGPMEPINLLEILERGARCVSRGGAVSGAAQVVVSDLGGRDRGIALSDGSRISFASVADAGVLKDDDAGVPGGSYSRVPKDDHARVPKDDHARVPKDDHARVPKDDHARVPGESEARVPGETRARRLASV